MISDEYNHTLSRIRNTHVKRRLTSGTQSRSNASQSCPSLKFSGRALGLWITDGGSPGSSRLCARYLLPSGMTCDQWQWPTVVRRGQCVGSTVPSLDQIPWISWRDSEEGYRDKLTWRETWFTFQESSKTNTTDYNRGKKSKRKNGKKSFRNKTVTANGLKTI